MENIADINLFQKYIYFLYIINYININYRIDLYLRKSHIDNCIIFPLVIFITFDLEIIRIESSM